MALCDGICTEVIHVLSSLLECEHPFPISSHFISTAVPLFALIVGVQDRSPDPHRVGTLQIFATVGSSLRNTRKPADSTNRPWVLWIYCRLFEYPKGAPSSTPFAGVFNLWDGKTRLPARSSPASVFPQWLSPLNRYPQNLIRFRRRHLSRRLPPHLRPFLNSISRTAK